ncbi:MAG TPA: hypothetical protein VFA20_11230 [Myxococcaceae bacterium]|nr:hypothetical protein [Myxococcaceae bacterium]
MPYQYSLFQLPGGTRCARIEWTGVATGEAAAALVAECAPGQPLYGLPMLILTQKMETMEARARSVFSSRSVTPLSEFLAIVASNPIIRVATNFIMRLTKNPRQRMFPTEAEALGWLDERTREYAAAHPDPGAP